MLSKWETKLLIPKECTGSLNTIADPISITLSKSNEAFENTATGQVNELQSPLPWSLFLEGSEDFEEQPSWWLEHAEEDDSALYSIPGLHRKLCRLSFTDDNETKITVKDRDKAANLKKI